jgi:zinc protease
VKVLNITCAVMLLVSSALAQKEVPLPKDLPPYGPEKPLAAPAVTASTLDNGLTVWLVSEPGFPKIAFSLAVRGGFAADPTDRPGISELLSKTIDQGSKTRTAKQVAQEIQAAGGDLAFQARNDYLEVSTTILSSQREGGVAVLSDVLQNASFPEAEVTLAKRNAADELRQRESEPSFLAARAMARVLFGDHPYHVTAPTQESISASSPTDLRTIYAQRFRPDQTLLVAVGDFENAKMLELIKAKFGMWKTPNEAALQPPPAPSATPPHAVFLVTRPGSVQTTLELGAFGPLRGDPDYEAAELANAIYGGTFSSRLVSNIREDKGYTYSPRALLRQYREAGTAITRADVRNEVTSPSFNEITYELNRLATTSPTDEELTKAKRFLVGIEAIRLQARAAVAAELASIWVYGLPPEEIGIYGQKVSTATSADVDAAARKYFPAAKAAIVAVGEEKVIRDAMAPFAIPVQKLQ